MGRGTRYARAGSRERKQTKQQQLVVNTEVGGWRRLAVSAGYRRGERMKLAIASAVSRKVRQVAQKLVRARGAEEKQQCWLAKESLVCTG